MDLGTWREYLALLDGLSETLAKLTQVEKEKAGAVVQGDLDAVDECMKQEQVLSLSLRGADQKREKLLAKLGMTGVPLRRIEEFSPDELLMDTKRTAEKLRRRYEVFQGASDLARNTLESNLHAIEKIMAAQEAQAQPPEQEEARKADFRG